MNDGCPNGCADYQSNAAGLHPVCTPFDATRICVVSDSTFSFVLVIDAPLSPYIYRRAQPLLYPYPYLIDRTFVVSSGALLAGGVVKLPPISPTQGAYLASKSNAQAVNRYLGNDELNGDTTLPVHAVFAPQFVPSCMGCPSGPVDATLLGLPLPAAPALQIAPITLSQYMRGYAGPGMTPAVGWVAAVPLLGPSGGSYRRIVSVDPPFDDSFPPDVGDPADPPSEDDDILDDRLNPLTPLPTALNASTSVAGWKVYVRQELTLRRVSNVVTLGTAPLPVSVPLFLAGTPSGDIDVVVEPSNPAMPSFVNLFLNRQLALTYPSLPPPVAVDGFVRAPSTASSPGAPVSATLVFHNTPGSIQTLTGKGDGLFFDAQIATDDQTQPGGTVGHYAVTLPPGTYDVFITPGLDSGFAKVKQSLVVPPPMGSDLTVDIPPLVTGTCHVSDGRPLAGADIDLRPAATLAAQGVPSTDWPRSQHVQTGRDGSFSVPADEVGAYDVTIRPSVGTRLPWIVSPSHAVGSQPLSLDPLPSIPAPIHESITLHDSDDGVVANAVVRAFVFSSQGSGPNPVPVALEIGSGLTDATGHVDLFLTRVP